MCVEVSQAATDTALKHFIIVVVRVAQGFLKTLQGLLENAKAKIGVAHAEADLTIQLKTHCGTLHVQACFAIGNSLLEFAELLIAACQVQVALGKVVRVLQLPGCVNLHNCKLLAENKSLYHSRSTNVITRKYSVSVQGSITKLDVRVQRYPVPRRLENAQRRLFEQRGLKKLHSGAVDLQHVKW